jgi:hypothetical protein
MICGNFTVSRPSRGSVLELLPPVLLLKPDGGWRLARSDSATHGERVGARASRPTRRALTTDGSALRRGVAKLDQVSQSRRRRLARGDGGPAYRTGASVDPRTTGSALDPSRPRAARGARPLGVFGALHQARRPVHAPLSDRTPDGGGCVSAGIQRRGDCTDCEPVGYETAAAFSKLFHRHHGLSPGRYRAARRSDGGRRASGTFWKQEVAGTWAPAFFALSKVSVSAATSMPVVSRP